MAHGNFPNSKIKFGYSPGWYLIRELKEEFIIDSESGDFVAEGIFDYGGNKFLFWLKK